MRLFDVLKNGAEALSRATETMRLTLLIDERDTNEIATEMIADAWQTVGDSIRSAMGVKIEDSDG